MNRMDDDALRVLVREAVRRHLEPGAGSDQQAPAAGPHASHVRYVLPESEGPCLIEPAVRCNHCGYCQSHGH